MIRRTRELKIECCVNDGRSQDEGFPEFSYCPLHDSGENCCNFYGRELKDNPFNAKPGYCHVTRITIEEEI